METIAGAAHGLLERLAAGEEIERPTGIPSPSVSDASAIDEARAVRWREAGVPRRFQAVTWDALEQTREIGRCRAYAAAVAARCREGRGLMLKGAVGTGKTTAACLIARAACDAGLRPLFLRSYRLVDELAKFKTFSDRSAFDALEKRLQETDLLILDDFGLEVPDTWADAKVHGIIADRYDECRAVVLTTNLDAQAIRKRYEDRIIDRLGATCETVVFAGSSRRRAVAS